MSFNKFFPDRPEPEPSGQQVLRAQVLRYFWIVSTLMLVMGYVLAALAWNGLI